MQIAFEAGKMYGVILDGNRDGNFQIKLARWRIRLRGAVVKFMKDLDKHYMVLGLKRGATQKEIRSAFRQMTKLYHPDQNSSLDAQVKYHEMRLAYDALREVPRGNPWESSISNPTAETEKKTTCGTGWYIRDDSDYDDVLEDLIKTPEEKDALPTVSLHDYFFQAESIFVIAGSMLLFFVIQRVALPFPITGWVSVRFFVHMTASICVSWLVIGHVRLTHSSRSNKNLVIVLLSIAHYSLIRFFTFREEFVQHYAAVRNQFGFGEVISHTVIFFFVVFCIFFCVFYCATRSLEIILKHRLKKNKRSRSA